MKKIYIILILAISITSCKTLKNNSSKEAKNIDVTLFNKGVTIFEIIEETSFDAELKKIDTTTLKGRVKFETLSSKKESILDYAFDQFNEIVTNHSNSELYHKALYNLAQISSILDYEEDEIKYLKMILESNADDKENSGRSGIMSNPYANFNNEASNRLSEIYIKKGNYNKALEYTHLSEKYPFQHFCGNAFAANEIYKAEKYGRIYDGLGDTNKALGYLLPELFNNIFASNSDLVKLTYKTLKNRHSLDLIKSTFNNSIENYYSKKDENNYNFYFIKYFNIEIEISNWDFPFETDKSVIKAKIRETIEGSEFYKTLYLNPVIPKA